MPGVARGKHPPPPRVGGVKESALSASPASPHWLALFVVVRVWHCLCVARIAELGEPLAIGVVAFGHFSSARQHSSLASYLPPPRSIHE